jgi:hypothetical protein
MHSLISAFIKGCQENPLLCFETTHKAFEAMPQFKAANNFKYTDERGNNYNVTISNSFMSTGVSTGIAVGGVAVLVCFPFVTTIVPAAGIWGWFGYTTTASSFNIMGVIAGCGIGAFIGRAVEFFYTDDNAACVIKDTTHFVDESKFSIECTLQGNSKIMFDITFDA